MLLTGVDVRVQKITGSFPRLEFSRLCRSIHQSRCCRPVFDPSPGHRVDEEGTEASAATSVGIGPTSAPPAVEVDRPFVVAIRENHSGTILFVGVVMDPATG
jgi:hypothetical protein